MHSVYLRRVGVLLVVLLIAGCGGGGADDPQQVGESADLTQYEVQSDGFSVGVPTAWRALTADEHPTREQFEELLGDNRELQPVIEAMTGENSPIRFMALDLNSRPEFATNLNVLVESPPDGVTRQQYFDAGLAQIGQFVPPAEIESERVSLPAGPALRLSYEHSEIGFPIAAFQYILFEDGNGYVLTYSTLPEELADRTAEFKQSARSFTID
jgi:hypothetical protein